MSDAKPRPLAERTFIHNGGGMAWAVPEGIRVEFAGEGEWKITLDVFRDLGLAFGAAMVMIYVILVMQTGSFLVPLVVMLAIPLTVLGVMPGFWLLNRLSGQVVGGYADPVLFTATAMIGMIALAGIVTRDSIILVDFIGQSVREGPTAVRRDHGKPRGADAADPADRRGGDALEHPDHARPDLLRAGLVADLRAVRLDDLHAVRDPGDLLAAPPERGVGRRKLGPGQSRVKTGNRTRRPHAEIAGPSLEARDSGAFPGESS